MPPSLITPQDLILLWTARVTRWREQAETLRRNGMLESARGLRLKADLLQDCATELQAITPTTAERPRQASPEEVRQLLEFEPMPEAEFAARLHELQNCLRNEAAEAGPNEGLEGWPREETAPPSTKLPVPVPVALPTPQPTAPASLVASGDSAQSTPAGSPKHQPMSSVNSSPEPTWDDAGINPDAPVPFTA